jgi:hypothetical protein
MIIHPSREDAGNGDPENTHVIGKLFNFVPLNLEGQNKVDAAVASTSLEMVSAHHHGFTINPDPLQPNLTMLFIKAGRTTGYTEGQIIGIDADLFPAYELADHTVVGYCHFVNQLVIQGVNHVFSARGDSGALIVELRSRRPVGLLFAGTEGSTAQSFTYANPICDVMAALNIDRFVDPNPSFAEADSSIATDDAPRQESDANGETRATLSGTVHEVHEADAVCWLEVGPGVRVKFSVPLALLRHLNPQPGLELLWSPGKQGESPTFWKREPERPDPAMIREVEELNRRFRESLKTWQPRLPEDK